MPRPSRRVPTLDRRPRVEGLPRCQRSECRHFPDPCPGHRFAVGGLSVADGSITSRGVTANGRAGHPLDVAGSGASWEGRGLKAEVCVERPDPLFTFGVTVVQSRNRISEVLVAQLNVRLEDHVRDSFDALARARGLSGSDLLRSLIDGALGRDDPQRPRADPAPQSLSAVERQTLAQQHQILAHLTIDPDEDDGGWETRSHRNMMKVLNYGWTAEYARVFEEMQPEMSRRECSLVMDVLEMFTNLKDSLSKVPEERRGTLGEYAEHALTFGGFDFNDAFESRLASYASYLIETGRWASISSRFDAEHEHGNSHSPRIASYERMLSVWRPIWQKKIANYGGPTNYHLSENELRQVRDAWPYPDK